MKKKILFVFTFFVFAFSFNTATNASDTCGVSGSAAGKYIPEYWTFSKFGAIIGMLSGEGKQVYVGNACMNHDRCYSTPNANKDQCDNTFRREMLEACNSSLSVWSVNARVACIEKAEGYYQAVRNFGQNAFNNAQR